MPSILADDLTIADSQADLRITPASVEDADRLAPNLREADLAEVTAFPGGDPAEILRACVRLSVQAWSVKRGEAVLAMWGVTALDHLAGVGIPWLLTGNGIERYPILFARASRLYVKSIRESFPTLINYIDARHTIALRWAEWLGFKVGPPELIPGTGYDFRKISMEA